MFVFATVIATYACIEPLVMASYSVFPRPILQLPRVNLGCAVIHLEFRLVVKSLKLHKESWKHLNFSHFRQFLLMVTAISISVVWAVCRKEDWAWALQGCFLISSIELFLIISRRFDLVSSSTRDIFSA